MMYDPLDAGLRVYDAGVRLLDAGVSAGPALPTPDQNPEDFFARVFAAFTDRNWRYLAALTVIGAVYLARRALAAKITALQHGKWAWTLAVVGAGFAAEAAHLASSAPVGGVVGIVSAFMQGGFVGLAGAGAVKGAYEWWKPVEPAATDPAVTPPPPEDYTRIADTSSPRAAPTAPKAFVPPVPPKLPPKR
jgi:hypothetical protein